MLATLGLSFLKKSFGKFSAPTLFPVTKWKKIATKGKPKKQNHYPNHLVLEKFRV
jgi:hypothetical protein